MNPRREAGESVAHGALHPRREGWADDGLVVLGMLRHHSTVDGGCDGGRAYFLALSPASLERAAMKASWGTSTRPTIFIRFLPSFCFSSSLRLRVMSPP